MRPHKSAQEATYDAPKKSWTTSVDYDGVSIAQVGPPLLIRIRQEIFRRWTARLEQSRARVASPPRWTANRWWRPTYWGLPRWASAKSQKIFQSRSSTVC